MLFEKTDMHRYRSEFKTRFTNFCHKAPFLISFFIEEQRVRVIDEATSLEFSFEWNITIPVKKFIFQIKETLVQNGCYPIIIGTTQTSRDVTPDEVAEEMANGVPLKDTTLKVVTKELKKFMIDKVVIFKDFFILKDLLTGQLLQYKLDHKSVIFLKKLRTNKLLPEEAGNYFFKEAEFIRKLNSKVEE